jgi:hypothetical protein
LLLLLLLLQFPSWPKSQWWIQSFDLQFFEQLRLLHVSLSWWLVRLASACAGGALQQSEL